MITFVKECGQCPYYDPAYSECMLVENEYRNVNYFHAPPNWCPLRISPVTIQLEDGV